MSAVGLFGKMPAKADFVRHHIAEPAARVFDNWLHQGVETLRMTNNSPPNSPVRFLFAPPGTGQVLVGMMVPSQDQVGRSFPLSAFFPMDAAYFSRRFAGIPVACDPFLEGLSRVLSQAHQMSFEQLVSHLEAVPVPAAAQFQAAQEVGTRIQQAVLAENFLSGSFDMAAGEHHYGIYALTTACQYVHGKPPEQAGTILDCPLSADVDLYAWLELASRLLAWDIQPPSFFWVEAPVPRMLLSLGAVHTQILRWFSDPQATHERLWPLKTEHEPSRQQARERMEQQLAAFAPGAGATLGQLLYALGGPGQ